MQPTKAEMKKWLAEVRDAAILLRDALNDTPISEFLEIASLGPIKFRGVFDQMVLELAGRAERPGHRRYCQRTSPNGWTNAQKSCWNEKGSNGPQSKIAACNIN